MSEIDIACRRVQKEILRRAAVNAKQVKAETEQKKRQEDEFSRERMSRARKAAGITREHFGLTSGAQSAILKRNQELLLLQQQQQQNSDDNPERKEDSPSRNNNKSAVLPSEITVDMIKQRLKERERNTQRLLAEEKRRTHLLPSLSPPPPSSNAKRSINDGVERTSPKRQRELVEHTSQSVQKERREARDKTHFNFSPFGHSRFSARREMGLEKDFGKEAIEFDIEDIQLQREERLKIFTERQKQQHEREGTTTTSTSAQQQQISQDMLRNAVHTGSSWTPSQVITQRTEDGKRVIVAAGAVQPPQPALPSTKAFSKTVVSSSTTAAAPSSSLVMQQSAHQQQQQQQRGMNESVFNYMIRTGVPAPTVEEMRSQSRLQARQLRPLLESKLIAAATSTSSLPNRGNFDQNEFGFSLLFGNSSPTTRTKLTSLTPSPSRLNHNHSNNSNNNNILSLVESALQSSPPPRAMSRGLDVNSMARSPPPYVMRQ